MERAELERYAALDASGFLPGVGEEPVDFESRIAAIRAAHEEFGEELAEKARRYHNTSGTCRMPSFRQ